LLSQAPPARGEDASDNRHAEDSTERADPPFSKRRLGEGDVKLDKERLDAAVKGERKRRLQPADEDDRFLQDKRRKYISFQEQDMTEEGLGLSPIRSPRFVG
jgi:pre-mRNA-processing factor SLU7